MRLIKGRKAGGMCPKSNKVIGLEWIGLDWIGSVRGYLYISECFVQKPSYRLRIGLLGMI